MKYKIEDSMLHGKGLFATQALSAGELILSEYALLSANIKNNTFSATQTNMIDILPTICELEKHELLRVREHFERVHGEEATRKFTDNDMKTYSAGASRMVDGLFKAFSSPFVKDPQKTKVIRLFHHATYLNHACNPNAEAVWNEDLGKLQLHATRAVVPGEEIMISYLPRPFEAKARHKGVFDFVCRCQVCTEDGYEITSLDLQRALIGILEFRAYFFEADDRDVDFFANAEVMRGKAAEIAALEKEDLEVVERNVKLIGERGARKAIAHAWHMVEGNEAMERHVNDCLKRDGVRLRRTWGQDGEVVVEIGRLGRVGGRRGMEIGCQQERNSGPRSEPM